MNLTKRILGLVLLQAILASGCSDAQTENDNVVQADTTHYDHTNKLIGENSPYLLSHAHNPVNWYPWGEEALAAAKREDKPIFLSIGYAACHWCHVMERESFENEEIATLMNQYFISIKVDREQRPDLDHIYMSFTQALTGGGGWPMSVFLTPELKPFYAGTYFPPDDRYGRPGFRKIITEIGKAYLTKKAEITESSEKIFKQMSGRLSASVPPSPLRKDMIPRAVQGLMGNFDQSVGGFGSKPKFPHPMELSLFMRYTKDSGDSTYLKAAELALSAMARGGIYDHLGGGFARYATDANWQVPHFEKMLYDNALLVPVYVEAYRVTGNPLYKKVVTETLDFILRELTDKTGGFYSSLDADSEGEEGKFYVWSKAEIDSILGDESEFYSRYYNVTAGGNFEGKNILHLSQTSDKMIEKSGDDFESRLKHASDKLFDERAKRIRPLTDDKILTAWNGLALTAFCYGYQITGEKRFLDAALKNAQFVRDKLYANGHLVHAYREGRKSEGRFLEDNGYYLQGLLDLYETDLKNNNEWLEFAVKLADQAIDDFMGPDGTLYLREDGLADLIVRPKDENDSAIPAPGSVLLLSLFKLNRITGDAAYATKGELGLKALSGQLARIPQAMTTALFALDYMLEDKIEVVIVGNSPARNEMISELYGRFLPQMVLAVSDDGSEKTALFEGRKRKNKNETLAYVCVNSACKLPVSSADNLREILNSL